MPGALQIFEATPKLVGNKVSWELCHLDFPNQPKPDQDCGTSKVNYPDVSLAKGQGAYPFQFTIVNDQTGKGIKFAEGPLVIKKGEPFGPGKDKQIGDVFGDGTKVLKFTDLNSLPNTNHPAPVTITYGLHFTDQNENPVTSIDPDITNGGTNIVEPGDGGFWQGGGYSEHLLPASLGLIAGVVLTLLFQAIRRNLR
jgi:hypothetical protein